MLNSNFNGYFKNYDFHNLYKELLNFCTVDLSAFYFDIRKDTLYCDPINSKKRKSSLILLNIILDILLRWFAPILSFTTEEIYQLVERKNKSIHLEKFLDLPKSFKNDVIYKKWLELIQSLEDKAKKWEKVYKNGRTHLMDATPVSLGQEFSGYSALLSERLEDIKLSLINASKLAIGGTAVGTGINAPDNFGKDVAKEISKSLGINFRGKK